jgi:hypothetical protein
MGWEDRMTREEFFKNVINSYRFYQEIGKTLDLKPGPMCLLYYYITFEPSCTKSARNICDDLNIYDQEFRAHRKLLISKNFIIHKGSASKKGSTNKAETFVNYQYIAQFYSTEFPQFEEKGSSELQEKGSFQNEGGSSELQEKGSSELQEKGSPGLQGPIRNKRKLKEFLPQIAARTFFVDEVEEKNKGNCNAESKKKPLNKNNASKREYKSKQQIIDIGIGYIDGWNKCGLTSSESDAYKLGLIIYKRRLNLDALQKAVNAYRIHLDTKDWYNHEYTPETFLNSGFARIENYSPEKYKKADKKQNVSSERIIETVQEHEIRMRAKIDELKSGYEFMQSVDGKEIVNNILNELSNNTYAPITTKKSGNKTRTYFKLNI